VSGVEALIVGAGPAGLATAIELTKRGVAARVIERHALPVDKACGEGIMPAGVRALEALGVSPAMLRAAPFAGVRFVEGRRSFSGRFATGPGLGVRRTVLSRALHEAAIKAGAEVHPDCALEHFEPVDGGIRAHTSQGAMDARVLVGADGLASRVRAQAGLAVSTRSRRFGMRRHYRIAPWSEFVEVHWSDDAEAYVTPVAADEVGIALLGSGGGGYDDRLARFRALAERLASAQPVSEVRGAGPFWQRARRRFAGNVALVGDAAGYTDAVTGEGITLALRCAEALAHAIAERRPLADYESDWRRLSREHRAFAALLGVGVAHPRARRAAFRVLEASPSVFEVLLRRAAGDAERAGPTASSVS
jgi:flavin-dependent dehydrogenase